MKSKYKEDDIVQIIWEDHCGMASPRWMSREELKDTMKDPHYVKTCGYVIEDNKKYILLAFNNGPYSINGDMKILKATIKSIKKLK